MAARRELLTSVQRWRNEIADGGPSPNTAWYGIAGRSFALAELFLSGALVSIVPAGEMPRKPTLGQLLEVLDRRGRRSKMSCLRRPRNLITNTDLAVVQRLVTRRNFIAHHAQATGIDPGGAGRLSPEAVLEFLAVAEAFALLPMFDELECRTASAVILSETDVHG